MKIIEINSKTILQKFKTIDSWFLSKYSMNLYRGCSHNCIYCDGRSEKYQHLGNFGSDIIVKANAIEILELELKKIIKSKKHQKGFILLGGGVCDTYQKINKKYRLSTKALELILKYNFPVHILTKSIDVLDDFEIISQINNKQKAIVSFSFSSTNDSYTKIFEPGASLASDKLDVLNKFKEHNISTGAFLMPIIPLITDTAEVLNQNFIDFKKANLDFVIFGGMTLKPGIQKDYFLDVFSKRFPDKIRRITDLYSQNDNYGNLKSDYYKSFNQKVFELAKKYDINLRIPQNIYNNYVSTNEKIITIFNHIDYYLRLKNLKSDYGKIAKNISELQFEITPLSLYEIQNIVGEKENLIIEILSNKMINLQN